MARTHDYGNPQYRARGEEEQASMRQAMAYAHQSFSMNGSVRGSVNVHIPMYIANHFGAYCPWDEDNRAAQIFSVIFDSCFARFRAEGRYGEMTMSFIDTGESSRDTY
tara:strand:- start:187 stop:510 length:324 start_codon:yes stop_codon:yes gene_type:complete